MAAITDYPSLVAAIQSVQEDDGQEFTAYIPTAIDIAEERLFRELDLPEIEQHASGSLSATIPTFPKPVGYRFANYINIYNQNKSIQLKKRREDYLRDYWPDASQVATPKYYSDTTLANFIVAPTPDVNYFYEMKFTAQPAKLTSTNTTNYYTDRCHDMLFYACLVEMAKFMKAWNQVTIWEAQYTALKTDWNAMMMRLRRDDGAVANNPSAGPNTVMHTSKSNT